MKKIILMAALPLLLTSCFEKQSQEEVHTVDWFLKHPKVMKETMDKCINNPGELADTPNCQNVAQAYHIR